MSAGPRLVVACVRTSVPPLNHSCGQFLADGAKARTDGLRRMLHSTWGHLGGQSLASQKIEKTQPCRSGSGRMDARLTEETNGCGTERRPLTHPSHRRTRQDGTGRDRTAFRRAARGRGISRGPCSRLERAGGADCRRGRAGGCASEICDGGAGPFHPAVGGCRDAGRGGGVGPALPEVAGVLLFMTGTASAAVLVVLAWRGEPSLRR